MLPVEADAQGSLAVRLDIQEPDEQDITLVNIMEKIINDEDVYIRLANLPNAFLELVDTGKINMVTVMMTLQDLKRIVKQPEKEEKAPTAPAFVRAWETCSKHGK